MHRRSSLALSALTLFLLFPAVSAQQLPGKIRGYKVYKTDVKVYGPLDTPPGKPENAASIKLTELAIVDVGLTGATLEMGAEIASLERSGKVDFLMFRDFTIHGIPFDVEEYQHPFAFKRMEPVLIPRPVRIYVSVKDLPKAVYKEVFESEDHLRVTGTVLVFGKFKKMGFEFKRVIPVRIDLTVPNPLHA